MVKALPSDSTSLPIRPFISLFLSPKQIPLFGFMVRRRAAVMLLFPIKLKNMNWKALHMKIGRVQNVCFFEHAFSYPAPVAFTYFDGSGPSK